MILETKQNSKPTPNGLDWRQRDSLKSNAFNSHGAQVGAKPVQENSDG